MACKHMKIYLLNLTNETSVTESLSCKDQILGSDLGKCMSV